jgi:RND superfamily putative drug exporter
VSKLLTLASGRRAKWIVAATWLLVVFVVSGTNLPGKLTDAENNESTSYLPGDAESTKALEATEALQGGETAAAVVVYRREGGLTAADRERIAADREAYDAVHRLTRDLGA